MIRVTMIAPKLPPLRSSLWRSVSSRAAQRVAVKNSQHKAAQHFPSFMSRYASRVKNAPVSNVTAFLILHELSAIVPLFGFWGIFYYYDYIPVGIPESWINSGKEYVQRLAKRNGWDFVGENANSGSRLVLQGAAAYVIVKAILPLRLMFSLWAMPTVANYCILPFTRVFKGLSKK